MERARGARSDQPPQAASCNGDGKGGSASRSLPCRTPARARQFPAMTRAGTGTARFPSGGDVITGYLAVPAGGLPSPGLVLVPDVRGLYEHFRDVARRFAARGFVTLAIDLYSREGTPDLPDMQSVFDWMARLPDARVLADLGAATRFIADHDAVAGRRVGVTGFCMGGQYALMAACRVPDLSACVSWYGMLRYGETSEAKPESPLEMAPRLACPYLGLFGEQDAIIPMSDVAALRGALENAGKRFKIVCYPDAGHAFYNDTRPEMYRATAARDAWARALAFLHEHLAERSG